MSSRFVDSLDFELMWGVRDVHSRRSYGRNILGVREAIPAILKMFRRYDVRATWAAVGMLLFETRRELLEHLPAVRPTYERRSLDPYAGEVLSSIGEDERRDPYHFGLSLARQSVDCPGMELGSHTFSHYYCLEPGQTVAQFRADLEASIAASARIAPPPTSLVFPRNQCNAEYLPVAAKLGFSAFRGIGPAWLHRDATTD